LYFQTQFFIAGLRGNLSHKVKKAGKSTWAKIYEDTIELDIIHKDAGKAKKE